jgi:plasmid stabilization system protein ParE
MAFRVETTEQSERDILNILDWLISAEAERAGLRWFAGLEQAIASLKQGDRSQPRHRLGQIECEVTGEVRCMVSERLCDFRLRCRR